MSTQQVNGYHNKPQKKDAILSEDQEVNVKISEIVSDAFDAIMAIDAQPIETTVVRGYDFADGVDYAKLFASFRTTGFQATSFSQAVEQINEMIKCRLKPVDLNAPLVTDAARQLEQIKAKFGSESYYTNLQKSNCTVFLGYTSNMISCGVRESIKFLVKNKMVDCLVTTCGGIEEDFMKCMAPAYMGEYEYDGVELRKRGLNRIGNMVVPNDNYRLFETWLLNILDQMLVEQNEQGVNWTPSKLINRLGKEINNEDSVYYWAWKNNIPVFCPAMTDGGIGDTIFYHAFTKPALRLDLVEDVQRMNLIPLFSANTGAIVLGGATPKHHILNANCVRNGLNYCVLVNTGQEFEGSDSGAKPGEALSWAKIQPTAKPVKIYSEASMIFPLLVAESFAKNYPIQKS